MFHRNLSIRGNDHLFFTGMGASGQEKRIAFANAQIRPIRDLHRCRRHRLVELDVTGPLDSRRVSPEVTSFELRAFDAGGGQLFVGYSAQGDRWSFTKPDGATARMELFLQAGVEAL